MKKYFLSLLVWMLIMFFSVYGGKSLAPGFVFSLPLLFLIFIFPYFPYLYSFFLAFLTALVLDTLGGLGATNLIAFFIALLVGIALLRFLEKSSFISQLILGEVMIVAYYLTLFLGNYVWRDINLGFIVLWDCLGAAVLYIAVLFIKERLQSH